MDNRAKAQQGLTLLKEAILRELESGDLPGFFGPVVTGEQRQLT
jgi:hypothetical protein